MPIHETAAHVSQLPRSLEYWKAVEEHPLSEVIPGLVAITAAQWKFWDERPLIVQSNTVTERGIIVLAREETAEKAVELAKLYSGDTSPLMVAMEAADEIVFLSSYVGFYPKDTAMWDEVGPEVMTIAKGAIQTIKEMQALAYQRKEYKTAERLSDIPKFIAETVIADKNESNYNAAYFVPVPPKYGSHESSQPVTDEMVIAVYKHARSAARLARNAIKRQGLYTAYGMPNHLGIFASLNGRTPEKYQKDEAVAVLQTSLRDHYRYYGEMFGEVGVQFMLNYFRTNNPAMIEVVEAALQKEEKPENLMLNETVSTV